MNMQTQTRTMIKGVLMISAVVMLAALAVGQRQAPEPSHAREWIQSAEGRWLFGWRDSAGSIRFREAEQVAENATRDLPPRAWIKTTEGYKWGYVDHRGWIGWLKAEQGGATRERPAGVGANYNGGLLLKDGHPPIEGFRTNIPGARPPTGQVEPPAGHVEGCKGPGCIIDNCPGPNCPNRPDRPQPTPPPVAPRSTRPNLIPWVLGALAIAVGLVSLNWGRTEK
jgi:hypothetical protein